MAKRKALATVVRVKPISPRESSRRFTENVIPNAVIEAFNDLISEGTGDGKITFTQDEVVVRIIEKMGCERAMIFEKKWLDVGGLYKEMGWTVRYHRATQGDDFSSFFQFSS